MMKRIELILLVSLLLIVVEGRGEIVRQAPELGWIDFQGKQCDLKSLRGQPIVVLIASSPKERAFRQQVAQLWKMYDRFSTYKLVCFAAFTQENGTIPSNIPFVIAENGSQVASNYPVKKPFVIAVIGVDGNLDYITSKVIPAQRLLDILVNNAAAQEALRRE